LTNFVNESAKAVGLGGGEIDVQGLTEEEASEEDKIYEKLEEINAKINALKESVESEDVIIKTWFESSE